MLKNDDSFWAGDPGPQGTPGVPYDERLETATDQGCEYCPLKNFLLIYNPTPPDLDCESRQKKCRGGEEECPRFT